MVCTCRLFMEKFGFQKPFRHRVRSAKRKILSTLARQAIFSVSWWLICLSQGAYANQNTVRIYFCWKIG